MKASLPLVLSLLFASTSAEEVALFNDMCQACTGSENIYCDYDDKCYSDNQADTCEHTWLYQQQSCPLENISLSDACEIIEGIDPITTYYKMLYLNPKTACGFYVRGTMSYIIWKDVHWPLQIYIRTN